jgi:hypothetical protein
MKNKVTEKPPYPRRERGRDGRGERERERVECKTKRQSTKISEPKKPTSRKHTIKQKECNFKLKKKENK